MKLFFLFFSLFLLLLACASNYITKDSSSSVLAKFDGYNWSWKCGAQSINFTVWKENIKVTQLTNFWLVQGMSSDPNDDSKGKTNDESGLVIIIYDAKNDSIVNLIHGKQIPALPDVDSNGNVVNMISAVYC
jgi:hypothetical protein